jgi:putative transcriptional regulator
MDMQVLRERAGLSRAEVAFRLAISETSVRNWEAGRTEPTMTPKKYVEALRLFKCTPQELADASEKSINQRHKRKPGRPKRFPDAQVSNITDTLVRETLPWNERTSSDFVNT